MFYRDEYNEMGYDYFTGEQVYGDDCYVSDDYMDERWWYINGAPGYMVSDLCRVWSEKSQKFRKLKRMDKKGHMGLCLSVNGKRVYKYIHILMAEAFLPNPHNLPIVRHWDDNPKNNYLDNLRWGTQKHNHEDCVRNGHAYFMTDDDREIGLEKLRTPILATNLSTGKQTRFRGQGEAARSLGLQQANIWKVLNGQRKHTCGYSFEYIKKGDDYDAY